MAHVITAFLSATGVPRPTERQWQVKKNKIEGVLHLHTQNLTQYQVYLLLKMWVTEITVDLEDLDEAIANLTYQEALEVLIIHLRKRDAETDPDWEARVRREIAENVEVYGGAVRASVRLNPDDNEAGGGMMPQAEGRGSPQQQVEFDVLLGRAHEGEGHRDVDAQIRALILRHKENEVQALERQRQLEEMILQQQLRMDTERMEWQRREREQQERIARGEADIKRAIQTMLREMGPTASMDDDLLDTMKKFLKEKEEKAMLTDSENEASCEKAVNRKATRVAGMIPEERRFLYASKASKMTHEAFMNAWDAEEARLMQAQRRVDPYVAGFDELRVAELKKLLRVAHKAMVVTAEGTARQRRAVQRVYQTVVDAFAETRAVMQCPSNRQSAAKAFRTDLAAAREKERTKDDHVVRYDALVENVTLKHGQSFSSGPGRQGGYRPGATNGPRRYTPTRPPQGQQQNQQPQRSIQGPPPPTVTRS